MRRARVVPLLLGLGSIVACVTVQDLGSHATSDATDGGVDTGTGFDPFGGDGSSSGTSGSSSGTSGTSGGPKLFFTSRQLYPGNLGGLAGADARCAAEALDAGLGGTFRAWLSTSTADAKTRISGGPWVFRNGEKALSPSSAGVSPDNFLRYDARGGDLLFEPELDVWTGTGELGLLDSSKATCLDWTSNATAQLGAFGTLGAIGSRWTHEIPFGNDPPGRSCSETLRLYCFEQ